MSHGFRARLRYAHGMSPRTVLAVLVLLQSAACGSTDPEASRGVVVTTSSLRATYTTDTEPVVGANDITLSLSTTADVAVTDAAITAEPWMIAHGHGSPEAPSVVELGNGDYSIENVVFSMPGAWELRTSIALESTDEIQVLKPVFDVR